MQSFNSLPNNLILDLSKLEALADNKINLTQKLKIVSSRLENIVGKRENAGYQHFLLSHIIFRRLLSQGSKNQGLFGKGIS